VVVHAGFFPCFGEGYFLSIVFFFSRPQKSGSEPDPSSPSFPPLSSGSLLFLRQSKVGKLFLLSLLLPAAPVERF